MLCFCVLKNKKAKAYTQKHATHILSYFKRQCVWNRTRELILGVANKLESTALMSTKIQQSTENWRRFCPKSSSLFCKDTEPKNFRRHLRLTFKGKLQICFHIPISSHHRDKRFVWQLNTHVESKGWSLCVGSERLKPGTTLRISGVSTSTCTII